MDNKGIKNYYKYLTQRINSAGTGMVNTYGGNLHITIPGVTTKGKNPIHISFIFALSDISKDIGFGKGIRLSYYSKITKNTDNTFSVENSDGSIDTYIPSDSKWINNENHTYIVSSNNSSDANEYYLYDKYSNKIIFDTDDQYPKQIISKSGYQININNGNGGTNFTNVNNDQGYIITYNSSSRTFVVTKDSTTVYQITLTLDSNGFLSTIKHINYNLDYSTNTVKQGTFTNTYIYDIANLNLIVKDGLTNYRLKYLFNSNYQITNFIDGYDENYTGGNETNVTFYGNYTECTNNRNDIVDYYYYNNFLPFFELDSKGRVTKYAFDSNNQLSSVSNTHDISNNENNLFIDPISPNSWQNNNSYGTKTTATDSSNAVSNILGNQVLCLNATQAGYIVQQTFNVQGNINDELTLSLWAKEKISPVYSDSEPDYFANVKIIFDTNDIVNVNIVKRYGDWQYIAERIPAPSNFSTITVQLTINTSGTEYYFNGLQLFQKPFGFFYKYNDEGNILSSIENGSKNNNQFGSNNLTNNSFGPSGGEYTYKYDSKNNLSSVHGAFNVKANFQYDQYNNQTVSQVYNNNNQFIELKKQYTRSGQSLNYAVDDSNNMTTYNFDETYSLLKSYTNSKNINSNYVYDEFNSIRKVTIPSNNIDDLGYGDANCSYNYNNNRTLDTITTNNGVVFKFNYDSEGKVLSVKIGNDEESASNPLISYVYENEEGGGTQGIHTGNIHSQTYGVDGDEYVFSYDEENKLETITINSSEAFNYKYDTMGRITTFNDLVNNQSIYYTYDVDGKLIQISDTDEITNITEDSNTIQYSYDNLNGINNRSSNIYGIIKMQSFDPLYRSEGINPESIYHDIMTSKTVALRKYVASFVNDETLKTVQLQDNKNSIISISPDYYGNTRIYKDSDNKYLSVVKWDTSSDDRLGYQFPTYGNYSYSCQTITGWFKPTSTLQDNVNKYIFSNGIDTNDSNTANFIGVLINQYGNLSLKLVDNNKVVYNPIVTSDTIKLDDWNFFSLTWYNRYDGEGYADTCSYELMLNTEYKKITKTNPRYNIMINYPDALFNFGCSRNASEAPTKQFVGSMTALILSDCINLNPEDVKEIYNLGKEYIFVKNASTNSGVTNYSDDLIDTVLSGSYDFIPLNNSLTGINDIKPYDVELIQDVINSSRNRSFIYDSQINRYAYVASGGELIYDFGLGNTGTLMIRAVFTDTSDKRYIYQNKDVNGNSISLYISGSSNTLYIELNGSVQSTNLNVSGSDISKWNFYSLSWENVASGDSLYSYAYNIKVYFNSTKYETQIGTNSLFSGLKSSIGRSYSGQVISSTYSTYTNYYPLYGLMEMLVAKNVYVTDANITSLQNVLKATSISKIYDEFGRTTSKILSTNSSVKYEKDLTYKFNENNSNQITTKIHNEKVGKPGNASDFDITYAYDELGNISNMTKDSRFYTEPAVYNYEYDFLNRIKREDNPVLNQSIVYTYDGNGNIKSKSYYSSGEISDQTPSTTTLQPSITNAGTNINVKINNNPYTQTIKLNLGDSLPNLMFDVTDASGNSLVCTINLVDGGLFNPNVVDFYLRTYRITGNNVDSTIALLFEVVDPGISASTSEHIDTFGYDDSVWKDRLTGFNDKTIKYEDSFIGNPTFYGSGSSGVTFNWEGRKLISYNDNTSNLNITYKYNDKGLRVSKTLNGTVTNYFYEGENLIAEKTGSDIKQFSYDENGQLISININGTEYYYVRDSYKTILGLIDTDGNSVIQYEYDAFGNILSNNDTSHINPFIYKGYYYDYETGLYYLKSRYYYPVWGRFLNSDGTLPQIGDISTGNIFVYCDNNPISYNDADGYFLNLIIGAAVGAIIGAGIEIASELVQHKKLDLTKIGIAAGAGAVTGLLAATGAGLGIEIAGNSAASALADTATQLHDKGHVNIGEVLFAGVTGAIAGRIGGKGLMAKGEAIPKAIEKADIKNLEGWVARSKSQRNIDKLLRKIGKRKNVLFKVINKEARKAAGKFTLGGVITTGSIDILF